MESANQQIDLTEIFGEVISSYSRAQAIADGVLVDVTETASEAGFLWPVAITQAAWSDCVEWTEEDARRQSAAFQDLNGRCWDVLFMAHWAIKTSKRDSYEGNTLLYDLYRVPRGGKRTKARKVTLKLITGPGDNGEPVVTIMLPNED